MTLNLLWSDPPGAQWSAAPNSYIIVDSARSHIGAPRFPQSTLGQIQRLPEGERTVEEGAQKILPLTHDIAVALAGTEVAVSEFARRLGRSLEPGRPDTVLPYLLSLESDIEVAATVAAAGVTPPFTVFQHPERVLFEVQQGHLHTTGSLRGEAKSFLCTVVQSFAHRFPQGAHPEYKLVAGLACATTMAMHYNLTEQNVGGAFFGARLDRHSLYWQPDIVYLCYTPRFSDGLRRVTTLEAPEDDDSPAMDSRFNIIACRVRDDVFVSMSTIGSRGVIASVDGFHHRIPSWTTKWKSHLEAQKLSDAGYFAFVPRAPGMVVVVPNTRRHVHWTDRHVFLSDTLEDLLRSSPPESKFDIAFLT